MRLLEVINTIRENLQATKYKSFRLNKWNEGLTNRFVHCNFVLQFFSGGVYQLEQPHAQSLFIFRHSFGINLTPFFNGRTACAAVHSILCNWLFDDLSCQY